MKHKIKRKREVCKDEQCIINNKAFKYYTNFCFIFRENKIENCPCRKCIIKMICVMQCNTRRDYLIKHCKQ